MKELKTLKTRRLKQLFGILMLFCHISLQALAETVTIDDMRYELNLNANTAECIGLVGGTTNKGNGDLVIPNSVQYNGKSYIVIGIGVQAFSNCTGFSGSLTLPSSLKTIGDYAFNYCYGFKGSLTIPKSVTTIGKNAFSHCSGFSGSLTIPNSVKEIDDFAFSSCTGFNGTLALPNSLTTIGTSAFLGCSSLNGTLELPATLTTIGNSAFYGCGGFTESLTLPNSLITIGSNAFYNCRRFTGSLVIPNSVTTIGNGAFEGCEGFNGTLTLSNSLTTIENSTFHNCRGFKGALIIPNSVTTIGKNAFQSCLSFTSLTLSNSVKTIGDEAFKYCLDLTGPLIIPNSVTAIGEGAFSQCTEFTGSLIIPESVSQIGNSAFSSCSGFDGDLVIPNSIREIPYNCFYDCNNISGHVIIGSSVKTISNNAFKSVAPDTLVILSKTPLLNANIPQPNSKTIYVPKQSYKSYADYYADYIVNPLSISVGLKNNSISVKESIDIKYSISAPYPYNQSKVHWRTSDERIASIIIENGNGLIIGESIGRCTITSEIADNKLGIENVSFEISVGKISFKESAIVLPLGEVKSNAIITDGTNLSSYIIAYSSSEDSVAMVNDSGQITGIGIGKATIKAWLVEYPDISAECEVYVSSLSLTAPVYSVKLGESLQLNAVLVPTDLPDKTLTWSSSDESVATVDSKGVVTGVSEGTVDITVENAYGQSASVKLFSLTQNREPYVLKQGEDIAIKDVFSDESISWASSDESVATVNQDGKVIAVGVGKATITATVEGKFSVEYVVYVPSLSLTTSSYSVKPGATLQLNAVLAPTDLPDKTLTWSSSDESVATVDSKGVVTGISDGTVDITVENAYGQSASVKLFSLTQNREPYVLKPGEDITIKDVFSDESISWTSSDESVATVNQDGKVIAVGVGKATITATVEGKFSVEYEIYVPSLNMTAPSNSVKPGATLQLKAVLFPTDLPDKTLTWSSSDESVATVDSKGVVTGVSDGTVDITVKNAYSQSASVKLFISNLPGISLSVHDAVMKPGEERAIKIVEDLSGRTVEWSSSNPEVASVDLTGNVTANKIGSAIITATLDNGMAATSTIYVAQVSISSSAELKVGASQTLRPTINPAELADRKLIWTTTDENCATVSENGEVKVVGFGPVSVSVALEENEAIAATCQILPNYEDGGISYRYDYQSAGAVICGMSVQDGYIIRKEIAAPYNNQTKIYSVVSVALENQPANLKKVAYPEGLSNNFSNDIVKIAYDASSCEIKGGVITEPVTGELVYVAPSISGEFEISSDINIVGPNAFACCGEITGLKIVGSSLPLAFHNITGSAPAFADCPLSDLFLGRNLSYTVSPFRNNKTLSELAFGAPVTEIGGNMFNGCDGLHEVTIPSTVAIVGNGAFGNCKGLSQFIIEDSRNTIEIDDAFNGSTMDYLYYGRQAYRTSFWPHTLKSIEIGRYVDTLRDSEFTDMAKLYSLTIGVGVRVINKNAFRSSKITKVLWLPNTPPTGYENIVADIYYVSTDKYDFGEADMKLSPNLSSKFMVDGLVYVFNKEASDRTCAVIDSRYNRYITALDVPHKVTYQNIEFTVEEINDYALYCNKYFEAASIGDGIISIGRYSLFNCDEIKTAPYIGKSVETIGDYAFNSCFKIPSVVIPDATKYLGAWSLANCSALESCLLGSGMETIQTGCFANDVSLKQLIVPANVTTIANQVFDNCTSFAYLEISDRTKTLSMGYSKHNPDYDPSQGVIGGLATAGVPLFYYCPLKEVYIGGDITYSTSPADGYSPFYRNDYLEKVIIHNNETDISNNEFYGCRNLKEVIVGNDVIRVGDYAFSGCLSLEYFTLGSKVETIGTDAFSDCDVMKELRSYNPVPPTCGDQAMDDINTFKCTLYVPKNAVEDYRNADQWKNFFHIEGMDVETVPVESITLDPEYWTGIVGSIFRIQATVNPITADNKHIIWASEDESVATVTEGGVVTAIGIGSTVITATCDNVVAVCQVVVQPIEAEYVIIDKQKAEIVEGETLQLSATVEPADATDQTITWSSSDETIATVDENGLVTAIKPGEATITASANNGLKAECKVTVTKRTSGINTIVVEGNSIIVPEGSEVYNMQGLRVNPEGLCSGFYIVKIAGMKAIKIRVD